MFVNAAAAAASLAAHLGAIWLQQGGDAGGAIVGLVFMLLYGLVSLAVLGLWIYALVDCLKVQDDSQYKTGTKVVWILVIVLGGCIGALVYLLVGRPAQRV